MLSLYPTSLNVNELYMNDVVDLYDRFQARVNSDEINLLRTHLSSCPGSSFPGSPLDLGLVVTLVAAVGSTLQE